MLKKVISGGQTGVDRAGLDAAMEAGIPVGGYCPKGRKAEDGVIPGKYPLTELESPESYYRTEMNVIKSDGTLILNKGILSNGTKLTCELAVTYGKPRLIIQLENPIDPAYVVRWIEGHFITVLNVAGPRESKCPGGIYRDTLEYLKRVFV